LADAKVVVADLTAGNKFRAAKEQVRKYLLFAKDQTKAAKDKMVAQMASLVAGINQDLGKVLAAAAGQDQKLRGQAVVARRKLGEWHETMSKLVPRGAAQNRGFALVT